MSLVTAIGIGIAGFGAYRQKRAADKQEKAQEEQNEIARRAERIKARRSRIQASRNQRRQSAAAENAAAQTAGGTQGSAVQGAIAALTSQTNANISFTNQLDKLTQQRLEAGAKVARIGAQANEEAAITQGALNFLDTASAYNRANT